MENIEQQPRRRNDHIKGNHTDICLDKPTEWVQFLAEPGGHGTIHFNDKNDLPVPINNAKIDYWTPARESASDSPFELNAEIDFPPAMVLDSHLHWQTLILDRLEETLRVAGVKPYILTHDTTSIYVHVAPNHLAHVITTSESDRCVINVQLESIDILKNAIALDSDIATMSRSNKPYQVLKGCLRVWSQTIDAVADCYGVPKHDEARPKRQISLSVKELSNAHIDEPEPWQEAYPQREYRNEAGVMFDDIAGYDDIKDRLRELIIQQKYPEIARNLDLDKTQGILLHGPPGTAKTMLLKAFANEINAELVTLPASEIIEKWVGSSARNLDTFFQDLIKKTNKIVLLMDEFDSLAVAPDEASSGERVDTTNRLKEWVTQITENHHNIILTAATNTLYRIDPAVVRPGRFLSIEVPVPNERTRQEIWSLLIGKLGVRAALLRQDDPTAVVLDIDKDIDAVELAKQTEGMVGAQFSAILNGIKRSRMLEYDTTGKLRPLSQADIINEIEIADEQD